jgi:hypothetical protein
MPCGSVRDAREYSKMREAMKSDGMILIYIGRWGEYKKKRETNDQQSRGGMMYTHSISTIC